MENELTSNQVKIQYYFQLVFELCCRELNDKCCEKINSFRVRIVSNFRSTWIDYILDSGGSRQTARWSRPTIIRIENKIITMLICIRFNVYIAACICDTSLSNGTIWNWRMRSMAMMIILLLKKQNNKKSLIYWNL